MRGSYLLQASTKATSTGSPTFTGLPQSLSSSKTLQCNEQKISPLQKDKKKIKDL